MYLKQAQKAIIKQKNWRVIETRTGIASSPSLGLQEEQDKTARTPPRPSRPTKEYLPK